MAHKRPPEELVIVMVLGTALGVVWAIALVLQCLVEGR